MVPVVSISFVQENEETVLTSWMRFVFSWPVGPSRFGGDSGSGMELNG